MTTPEQLDFKRDGVTMVTYPEEMRALVVEASDQWRDFYRLPDAVKQRLSGSAATTTTVGYEQKDGTGPSADRKENFDFSVPTAEELADVRRRFHDNPAALGFIETAAQLADEVQQLAETFGEQLTPYDDEVAKRIRAGRPFIRFLNYFGDRQAGDTIAQPHVDNGGFTFHLYESEAGCERLTYDTATWLTMPVAPGHAAVIPGMQLQLVSDGELRGLCHRVVATEQTKTVGRQAIVGFYSLGETPVYDKARHGRLQEYTPGFNYAMPPHEFTTLFTQL